MLFHNDDTVLLLPSPTLLDESLNLSYCLIGKCCYRCSLFYSIVAPRARRTDNDVMVLYRGLSTHVKISMLKKKDLNDYFLGTFF